MTAEKILAVARRELGIKESPANSNNVKYNTAYYGEKVSGSQYPWCCAFVWWVFQQAGAADLFYGGNKTAYCPTLMDFHKGQEVSGDYQPGDIIFFNFSGKKTAAHVGICESFNGVSITTIDGNTGSGNEADGGSVMRRIRNKKYIVKAYRPAYTSAAPKTEVKKTSMHDIQLPLLKKGASSDTVKAMQILLTGRGYSTRGFDGKFGTDTDSALRKFQKANSLAVDGKCGPASWKALLGTQQEDL